MHIIIICKLWMHLLCCLLCVANKDTGDDSSTNLQTPQQQMKTATVDTSTTLDHDFSNPLYTEPVKDSDSMTDVKSANQMQQSPSKSFSVI